MSERDIYCRDCTKFMPEKGTIQTNGLPAGFCDQYKVDQMPGKFLLNCPGADRISNYEKKPAKPWGGVGSREEATEAVAEGIKDEDKTIHTVFKKSKKKKK